MRNSIARWDGEGRRRQQGEKTMTNVLPGKSFPATASGKSAVDSPGARDPGDVTLFVRLSANLGGLVDYSEPHNGYWSDEPLRLADFVA